MAGGFQCGRLQLDRTDAPTPGHGLYHGGDTGSHVANPDALFIKKHIQYR